MWLFGAGSQAGGERSESVVARLGEALDTGHIRRWVAEFSRLTDDPEIVARFERAWENRPR